VLLNLLFHSDRDGTNARPATGTIAQETSLSNKTVDRALKEMRDARLIIVDAPAGQHRPAIHRLKIPGLEILSGVIEARLNRGEHCHADPAESPSRVKS
jgi:hypothetical protein